MVDQTSQFYAILTNVGAAKQANADALGIAWKITQMGVGDANGTDPTPNATQTSLINEWRRAPLNQLKVDDKNSAIIIAEQVIPADVGGKWIREIALYDADGDMVAVANCAPTYKPLLSQGSGRTQVVRMNLVVSSASNVQLKIDPAVVLATREYVDSRLTEEISKLDNKESVRVATTANITLSGLRTVDGVVLAAGDRVLVKNQTQARDNGLYVVATGAWPRSSDADISAEVTPGLVVAVEQGNTLSDTIWQLITDAPIVLGTTALTFRDITDGFARLLSPAFTGTPTAPTPPQFDETQAVVNAAFVKRMGVAYAGYSNYSASTALALSEVGKLVAFANAATPMTATLPTGGAITPGSTVMVLCSQGALTVTAAAGDTIDAVGVPGDIVMGQGDTAEFIRNGSLWRLVGGTALLRYSTIMQGENWVTPPQFDNTKKLATAEFVQRALGSFSGAAVYNAAVTLTKADAGKIIRLGGNGYTVTLPLISTLAEGATFAIQHSGLSGVLTVAVQGGDVIDPGAGLITSVTLNLGDTVILTRSVGSWALVGGSAALSYVDRPTLPVFDNSRQLATTEFVQRALGNLAGASVINATTSLNFGSFGKITILNPSAPITVTLPPSSTGIAGAQLVFKNVGSAPVTIVPAAGDTLGNIALTPMANLVIPPGSAADFVHQGTVYWASGAAVLKYTSEFSASLAVVGHERSPSGLIRQWGFASVPANGQLEVTLPFAFSVQCFGAMCQYTTGLGSTSGRCGAGPVGLQKVLLESTIPGASGAAGIYWEVWGK